MPQDVLVIMPSETSTATTACTDGARLSAIRPVEENVEETVHEDAEELWTNKVGRVGIGMVPATKTCGPYACARSIHAYSAVALMARYFNGQHGTSCMYPSTFPAMRAARPIGDRSIQCARAAHAALLRCNDAESRLDGTFRHM